MKFSSVLFAFVCMLGCYAQAAPLLPTAVEYRDGQEQTGSIYNSSFDQVFAKIGYKTVKTPGMIKHRSMAEWLNRIYFRPEPASGRVFAKSGIRVNGLVEFGKVYELKPGVFVAHLRGAVGTQSDTVFYFDHMSEQAAIEIMKSTARINAQTKNYNVRSKFFDQVESSAFAAETAGAPAVETPHGATNYFCGTEPVPKYGNDAISYLARVDDCTDQFMSGVWNASGALAIGAVAAVGHTIMHPIDTYNSVVQEIGSVRSFIGNMDTYLGQFAKDIDSLPMDTKFQIACELAGNIGTGAVIAAFTGGATGPELLLQTQQAVNKVTALTSKVKQTSVAIKLAKLSQAMKDTEIAKKTASDVKTVAGAVASTNGAKAISATTQAAVDAVQSSRGAKYLAASSDQIKQWYDDGMTGFKSGKSSEQMIAESKKFQTEAERSEALVNADLKRAAELSERDPDHIVVNKAAYVDYRADAKTFAAAGDTVDGAKVQSFMNSARNAAAGLKKAYALNPDQEAALGHLDANMIEVETKAKGLPAGSAELATVQKTATALSDRLNQLILSSTDQSSHLRAPAGGFLNAEEQAELKGLDTKITENAKKAQAAEKASTNMAGQALVTQKIEKFVKADEIVSAGVMPCSLIDMVERNKASGAPQAAKPTSTGTTSH